MVKVVPEKFIDWVKAAPVSSGVCCCGCDMEGHDSFGHTAVDEWDHSLSNWIEEIEKGQSESGWICYNGGSGSMFWMPTREDCEHELSEDIRRSTPLEKMLFERFGKKCEIGYELVQILEEEGA